MPAIKARVIKPANENIKANKHIIPPITIFCD